jgi:hypothetical protein
MSVLLGNAFPDVLATDASIEQLSHATRMQSVSYHCALAEQCALASRSIDLIVVAQAAHWFDLPRFYDEARRVARGGTPLVLMSYGNTYVNEAVDAIVMPFHDFLLNGYWPPERAHVDSGYRDMLFPFSDAPSPVMEMREQWDLARFVGYMETWSGVRALLKAGHASKLEKVKRDIAHAWGPPDRQRIVRWPLAIRAAIL